MAFSLITASSSEEIFRKNLEEKSSGKIFWKNHQEKSSGNIFRNYLEEKSSGIIFSNFLQEIIISFFSICFILSALIEGSLKSSFFLLLADARRCPSSLFVLHQNWYYKALLIEVMKQLDYSKLITQFLSQKAIRPSRSFFKLQTSFSEIPFSFELTRPSLYLELGATSCCAQLKIRVGRVKL